MSESNTVSVLNARKHLSDLLNRTAYSESRIRISRHGKPVAALVSIEDLELLEALEDRADIDLVERIKRESNKRDYLDWAEVKKEL